MFQKLFAKRVQNLHKALISKMKFYTKKNAFTYNL